MWKNYPIQLNKDISISLTLYLQYSLYIVFFESKLKNNLKLFLLFLI